MFGRVWMLHRWTCSSIELLEYCSTSLSKTNDSNFQCFLGIYNLDAYPLNFYSILKTVSFFHQVDTIDQKKWIFPYPSISETANISFNWRLAIFPIAIRNRTNAFILLFIFSILLFYTYWLHSTIFKINQQIDQCMTERCICIDSTE